MVAYGAGVAMKKDSKINDLRTTTGKRTSKGWHARQEKEKERDEKMATMVVQTRGTSKRLVHKARWGRGLVSESFGRARPSERGPICAGTLL